MEFEVIPKGTVLYHGSPEPYASMIREAGELSSRTGNKVSGGTLDEGGLIWFAFEEDVADMYARGWEAYEDIEPGITFRVELDYNMKAVDRWAEITTEREAEEINELLGIPDYKPLRKGHDLGIAVRRAFDSGRKDFKQQKTTRGTVKYIWPVLLKFLGADAMLYDSSIAVPADTFKVKI